MNNDKENKFNNYYVKNQDVVDLIDDWKNASGIEKKNIEAHIIHKLSYLIYKRIKFYRGSSIYEDLLQEGKIGIIKALNNFNTTRGPNFFKVAIWYIQTQIRDCIHKYHYNEIVEEDVPIEDEKTLDPLESFEEKENKNVLLNAINRLPEVDRRIVLMRYGIEGSGEYTLQQVGTQLDLSRERIRQIENRALSHLKKFPEIRENL